MANHGDFPPLALSALVLLTAAVGCSQEREAALAEVEKIDQACRRGSPDEARTLMLKAAEANREFGRAFADSAGGVEDRSRINACGLVLTRLKRRLERQR